MMRSELLASAAVPSSLVKLTFVIEPDAGATPDRWERYMWGQDLSVAYLYYLVCGPGSGLPLSIFKQQPDSQDGDAFAREIKSRFTFPVLPWASD